MTGRDARVGDGVDEPASADVLRRALDYRGDVTLRLDGGTSLVGYVFALETSGSEPHLRMYPAEADAPALKVPLAQVVGCDFTGRDTADGRSWQAWVKRHEDQERLRAQGLPVADIEPKPEPLE